MTRCRSASTRARPTGTTGCPVTGSSVRMRSGSTAPRRAGCTDALLHDVDVIIDDDTELSYVIGYRLDDELRYAGGHVAVDVVLDDGTRASEHGVVDQLGYRLDPVAQGVSKAMYPHQWNLRRVSLRSLARSTCGRGRAVLGRDTGTGRHRLPRPDPTGRPRRPGPNPTGRLGGDHPRHAVERTVQPRQQRPGHRLAQRVRLLHPGDRRPHAALGVLLGRPQRRPEPDAPAGAVGQPPAQPVDG